MHVDSVTIESLVRTGEFPEKIPLEDLRSAGIEVDQEVTRYEGEISVVNWRKLSSEQLLAYVQHSRKGSTALVHATGVGKKLS